MLAHAGQEGVIENAHIIINYLIGFVTYPHTMVTAFLKRNSNFLLICALMCIFGCEFKLKVRLPFTSTSSLLIYFLPLCHKFLILAIKTHN